MTTIKELQQKYISFIEERNWDSFHKPKNISMALSVEAAELMELFQWKDNVKTEKYRNDPELMEKLEEEIADIIMYTLSLAHQLDIDITEAVEKKLEDNEQRFDSEFVEEFNQNMQKWRRE